MLACRSAERGAGHVFTEEDWSLTPSESVLPYFCAKREAEKKAWEIAEKQSRCVLSNRVGSKICSWGEGVRG